MPIQPSSRPTVADLRAGRGQRQLTMLYVSSIEEAAAAATAGIDMLSIARDLWTPAMREAAGDCFVQVGLVYGELATFEDYLRAAFRAMEVGGDSFYCAASLQTIGRLAAEGVPVCGHVGLVPARRTWTGGFRAVGRTAASAVSVFEQVKALEAAGAFSAEIEVVPEAVAAAIHARTTLFLVSMGAGAGCDAQYLFAEDVLGTHDGHYPRHAKRYRDFKAEYDRLQQERIAAFGEFRADVESGTYPEPRHLVDIEPAELAAFMDGIEQR